MASVVFYRGEAERCRTRAAASPPDSREAARWRRLAGEYEQLAEALARAEPAQGNNGPRAE